MMRWRGRSGIFSQAISQKLFAFLNRWDGANKRSLYLLIIQGIWSCIWRGDGNNAFLLHTGHNDIESNAFWRNIRWHRLRPVFFIHDLIPLSHPQYCRQGEPLRHQQRVKKMLEGVAVIANSASTFSALQKYADSQQCAIPAHCVAMLAPAAALTNTVTSPLEKTKPSGRSINLASIDFDHYTQPYFVAVGTIEPRKNYGLLLEIWKQLLSETQDGIVPHLIVIGQSGWDCEDIEAQLNDAKTFQHHIHWITQCDDQEMVFWLKGAMALLFPSFVEGFGMPLAEALALQTPVIASDLDVFKEFASDVPLYLPPNNAQDWREAIKAFIDLQNPLRKDQLKRMEYLQLPTWVTHFEKVDALLESLSSSEDINAVQRIKTIASAMPSNTQAAYSNFSARKRKILHRYLSSLGQTKSGFQWIWGAQTHPSTETVTVQVEDGFIRSVGLGADLAQPISWVFDTRGVYFDARQASDLELLLERAEYSPEQLLRAANLREKLIRQGLTKYNLQSSLWKRPVENRHVVLVAGQVETDASINLGAGAIRTNLQLLQQVRSNRPSSYIVYKPHPDVVAGLRSGGSINLHHIGQLVDEVVESADMAQLLTEVDEVHVITSLTGFEALLRGKPVTVYGAPFYAGWGLCEEPNLPDSLRKRRTRRLNIDQLVAAALIDYPLYIHPQWDILITPEKAIDIIAIQRSRLQPKSRLYDKWKRHLLGAWAKFQGRY